MAQKKALPKELHVDSRLRLFRDEPVEMPLIRGIPIERLQDTLKQCHVNFNGTTPKGTNLAKASIEVTYTTKRFLGLFGKNVEHTGHITLSATLKKDEAGKSHKDFHATYSTDSGNFFERLFFTSKIKAALKQTFPSASFEQIHPKTKDSVYHASNTDTAVGAPITKAEPDAISISSGSSYKSAVSSHTITPADAQSIASEATITAQSVIHNPKAASRRSSISSENDVFVDALDTLHLPEPKHRLVRSVSQYDLNEFQKQNIPDSTSADTKSNTSAFSYIKKLFGSNGQDQSDTKSNASFKSNSSVNSLQSTSSGQSFHSASSNLSDATITSGSSYKSAASTKSTDTQIHTKTWEAKQRKEKAAPKNIAERG